MKLRLYTTVVLIFTPLCSFKSECPRRLVAHCGTQAFHLCLWETLWRFPVTCNMENMGWILDKAPFWNRQHLGDCFQWAAKWVKKDVWETLKDSLWYVEITEFEWAVIPTSGCSKTEPAQTLSLGSKGKAFVGPLGPRGREKCLAGYSWATASLG